MYNLMGYVVEPNSFVMFKTICCLLSVNFLVLIKIVNSDKLPLLICEKIFKLKIKKKQGYKLYSGGQNNKNILKLNILTAW